MTNIMTNMDRLLGTDVGRRKWMEATGGTPEECPPIYSFDNPSIHTSGTTHLVQLGLVDSETGEPTSKWLKLPPHSPDLHRTIERVHARVCGAFQAWLYDDRNDYCLQGYCNKLWKIMFDTQLNTVIKACMSDISDLYHRVVELKGDIPERRYR